jgi:cell division septum initiation protein DivIVA
MDIKALLTYVVLHVEQIFGTTLVLVFIVSIILLIRSIGEKKGESHASTGPVDLTAIEGAMKRVLSSQPVSVIASGGMPMSTDGGGEIDPAAMAGINDQLRDREQKIEELKRDIEAMRQEMEGASKGGDGNEDKIVAMQTKIDELQARLMEYEIIEDDIADLSLFKEENVKLKAEVEELKAKLAAGSSLIASAAPAAAAPAAPAAPVPATEIDISPAPEAVAPAPAPVEAAPAPEVPVAEAPAPAPAPAPVPVEEPKKPEPEMKFEKAEKFELDPNDEVMKEFAQAVTVQRAPPPSDVAFSVAPDVPIVDAGRPQDSVDAMLASVQPKPQAASAPAAAPPTINSQNDIDAMFDNPAAVAPAVDDLLGGTPDPDKMLSELSSMGVAESDAGTDDPFAQNLDMDKLTAETTSLKPESPAPQTAAPASPVEAEPQPQAPPEKKIAPEDDLLAEFKD